MPIRNRIRRSAGTSVWRAATPFCTATAQVQDVTCARLVDGNEEALTSCPIEVDGDALAIVGRLDAGDLVLRWTVEALDPSGNRATLACELVIDGDRDGDGVLDEVDVCLDDPDPLQSLGHSVGRWDGDTLVVDVVGFSDYTWIDNNAGVHSDALHIVERFRMIDKDTIEYRALLEDPKAWTKPWNVVALLKRRPPTDALMEYNCSENNKADDFPSADKLLK